MTVTSDAQAISNFQTAAGLIQDGLAWWETQHPSPEVDTLHNMLFRMGLRAEGITGATTNSIAKLPGLGGTPKPS